MVNLSILRSLVGNDEAVLARFIGIFTNETPQQMTALRQFLEEKDWENASHTAHTIKSQCGYFGLEEACDLCQQIESEPATAMERFDRLAVQLQSAMAQLRAL